ncbi:MAG: 5-formyltetrahydrofolate cyclo-ligase [Polyangiaceae bacterium]|nr:5-formyltetrahydrofolate cyclo-ligase [Polyangiaceae bacterium]
MVTEREDKAKMRQLAQGQRQMHSAGELETFSGAIRLRVLELIEEVQAQRVALFWPMVSRGEVDLRALAAQLKAKGKDVYYPYMKDLRQRSFEEDGFVLIDDEKELAMTSYGFRQPAQGKTVAAENELDLIVIPALAVTRQGHRLGYGAGYYDRQLSKYQKALRVIVAYSFQIVEQLPVEPHDCAAHHVITNSAFWAVGPSASIV